MKATRPKWRREWIYAGVLLAFRTCASTVPSTYQLDVWQTDEGLPQSTVTSIAQTDDGYLWLATQNGLVRFDGVSFKAFNEDNTPAIRNNRFVHVFVDRRGTLWVSGEQGELLCLRNGLFTSYEMPGKGTPFNYAREMCDDAEGNLWIVSCEWRLIRFGTNGFTVPSANWSLQGSQPAAVACDLSGRVWVNTENELAVCQNGAFRPMWTQPNEGNFNIDLTKSRSGGIWVAANGGLRKYEEGRWVEDLAAYSRTNAPIYDLYEDSHHRLWVATMGRGLFRYDPDGTVLHLTARDGLPTDFVRCVIEDREGNVWVGMESGGLCRLRPVTFQTLGIRQGLSSDQVTSVCESSDGTFWIAMDGEGLDHVMNDGRVEHYGSSQGLMNGHVWAVVQDKQGVVWAGTWDGLFRRDRDRFVDTSDGVNIGRQIFAIYGDNERGLWIGQQGFGMTRLDGSIAGIVSIPGAPSSLDVRVMTQDAAGNLWVGTENDGLYRRSDNQWTHFGRQEGLGSDMVWSLCAEGDGTIWIGTCGGGLSRWKNGRITTWTTKNGLINDVICQILDDGKGSLWLGSNRGVYRVSKAQLARVPAGRGEIQCVGYDKNDGLPSVECVGGFQPSGLRSRDGRLWFPTVKGFAIVRPDDVPSNPMPPPVVIDGVMVDGATMLPGGNAVGIDTLGGELKVRPGVQRLEFQYAGLSLIDPQKVRFKYKLEGLEEQWNGPEGKHAADYSHIAPGHYTFHVIACNNDGIWNDAGASLAVTVLPFFWQTRWFITLVVLTVLGSVAASMRYVVKRKLQRRIELVERERAIEAERGRIANDIHDDLGAGLTEIVLLSELAQNPDSVHDLVQSDLRKVTDKARALTHSLDEIVWAVNPENDTLDSFVSYACNFAQEYLQLAKIRCRLSVPASLPDSPLATHIRHNLFMVIKEALHNIVKHAGASEVWIEISGDASRFTVLIRDDGKGFNPEPAAKTRGGQDRPGGGHGLHNMRKRIETIGGEFHLHSRPGEGTRIELTVHLHSR